MKGLEILLLFASVFHQIRSQVPQGGVASTQQRLSAVSVSIEPKRPMTKCSGQEQKITCQLIDYEGELPKQMKKQQENSGYGGYLEFLLFKKGKNRQRVVNDIHVNYPSEILSPKDVVLANLTIFDKGEYNCTVIWHGITGDSHWYSEPLQLNVYDCIDLEVEILEAKQGDSVTMQCIDVEAPIKWYKDDDLLDAADEAGLTAASRAGGPVPGLRSVELKSMDDAGMYTCKATFEDTQQIFTKLTKVMIKTAPTTPINIVPIRLSPTTVVLKWRQKSVPNAYVAADPTFYTVFYKPMDSDAFLSKTVLKTPEIMLANLKPNTVYFVRIQAENELGTSVSGSRIVVTPAASQVISIDRRLLNVMQERVKILDQDLKSISNVLTDITVLDDKTEDED